MRRRQESALEAGVRPFRGHDPACVTRLRRQREPAVAAKREAERRGHRPLADRRCVEPGEEARTPGCGRSLAGLQHEAAAIYRHRGRRPEQPARVLQPEAQLGTVVDETIGGDPEPREVARQREPRGARRARLEQHRFVDRTTAALRGEVGLQIRGLGRQRQLAPDHVRPDDPLAALLDRLGHLLLIRQDEDRPRHRLRPAPALRDRSARGFRLRLAIVVQQIDAEERDREKRPDQNRHQQFAPRGAVSSTMSGASFQRRTVLG